MRRTTLLIATAMCAALAAPLSAQQYVYPSKGQSAQQQQKDENECSVWAKQQSGFDPANPPTPSSAPPSGAKGGSAVKGAVGGGAVGGLVGSMSANAGKGVLIGAAAGGLLGAMKDSSDRKSAEADRREWEQQQARQIDQQRQEYNRAYGACLEGRGYTVR